MKRLAFLLITAFTMTFTLVPASPASAQPGTILRTITVAPAPMCGVTVGIAFDGSELLVSCNANFTVTRVNPANGVNLGSYTITGILPGDGGIGAMSWDADVGQLWVGSSSSSIHHIYSVLLNKTLSSGVATLRITHTLGGFPITDGLAYDGTDPLNKFIWFSPDVSDTIYRYSVAGGPPVQTKSGLTAALGGCGNSGIAVADVTTLYLANDGCSQIYTWNKAFTGAPTLFATVSGFRLEDLECDNKSFAPKSAMWSKDAFDFTLRAFEVPAGQCAQGGVVKPPSCDPQDEDKGKGRVEDEHGKNGGDFENDECDEDHNVQHEDPDHKMSFKASTHGPISFSRNAANVPVATTVGQGIANGNPVRYVLVQTGGLSATQSYSLTLSDASGVIYQRSGRLISGAINVSHR
jgi:hypothetical protein